MQAIAAAAYLTTHILRIGSVDGVDGQSRDEEIRLAKF
jgi:hypothetical protein